MPILSQESIKMPDSPIRRLSPFAVKAKQNGIKVHHLNIGQPDLQPPQAVNKGIQELPTNVWAYTQSEGLNTYKTELKDYFGSKGIQLEKQNILPTNGASEAIIMALAVIANPADEVIVPEPFYANYTAFLVQIGVKVISIACDENNGYALPSISAFEEKITPKTRAIFICNPCNPTGAVYPKEDLIKLGELVKKHDIFLLSDEVYSEFDYSGTFSSILELSDYKNNSIVIDSESKRFSLCGSRLGSIISYNEEFISLALKYARSRLCAVHISQWVGAFAHKHSGDYLELSKKEYQKRIDFSVKRLNSIEGVSVKKPQGAFYLLVTLDLKNTDEFCKWLLTDFQFQNETLMLSPGSGFYSNPESGKNKVRIALVKNIQNLERCFTILEKALVQFKEFQTKNIAHAAR